MKLGVGYIALTGMEFLEPSLRNIRPFADYIVLVWSHTSHAGDEAPEYMEDLLNDLVQKKLIDKLHLHDAPPVDHCACMQDLCRTKREVARKLCMEQGCSHFLVRDCDEFTDPIQFKQQLDDKAFNLNVSVCPLYEYWGSPLIRSKALSGLWVPSIQKIEFPIQKTMAFPKKVDKGRCASGWKTCMLFGEEELVMHHFTACRYDERELDRKYHGHGHLNRNWKDAKGYKAFINGLVEQEETIRVPDIFGIMDYWKKTFGKYAAMRG